jgi:tetratricopeptide (TPR) repeat protein
LRVHRYSGHRWGQAWALTNLGVAFAGLHRLEDAVDYHQQALAIHREVGNRWGEGHTLASLGDAVEQTGRLDLACQHWRQAVVILDELQDPKAGKVRARLEAIGEAARPIHQP